MAATRPPAAHEDLTIAETLETLRVTTEHRPGEQCYRDEAGGHRWLAEAKVEAFLREFGAEHPSNFQVSHGIPWTQVLFQNAPHS